MKSSKLILLLSIFFHSAASFGASYEELGEAINDGDVELVKTIVGSGLDINPECQSYEICRPIAWAVLSNKLDVIIALHELGADPNGENAYGDTSLHYVVQEGLFDLLRPLMRLGGDINKPNNFGISPFLAIVNAGYFEIVEFLVANGADINQAHQNQSSSDMASYFTPLMVAAMNGHEEVVKLLIENGAKPELKNSDGKTAMDLASENGHTSLMEILE